MKRIMLAMLSVVMIFSAFSANAAVEKTGALGGFNSVVTYTPTSKSPLGGRSLLIVLHGCAQANTAFKTAKLGDAADANGMVVAVPDAMSKAGMSCWDYWGMAPTRTLNDYGRLIKLAQAMVADKTLEIDANQVYIAGLSSGGAFAMETACLAPDIFAGMGLVGAPSAGTGMGGSFGFEGTVESTRASCVATAGTYKSHFDTQVTVSAYGTADGTVNKGYGPQNAKAMAKVYGHSDPTITMPSDKSKALVNSEKTVVLLELTGEGHAWPGGAGASGSFIGGASLNYATFLGKFFNENNRRVTGGSNNPPVVNVTATAAGVDIMVSGTATDSDGTVASATIELKTIANNTVKGPFALSLVSGQFSYNSFTNLANGTYEVTVKATDDKGAVTTASKSVQITAMTEEYTVTASASAGGTVNPTSQKVQKGKSATINVTANSGYSIAQVTGCNGSLSGNSYYISSVTANCSVQATFSNNPVNYTVTASAGAGGSVSPATQQVSSGQSASVSVNANSGYTIASVSGCGGSLSGSSYFIPSVTANCSVVASFNKNDVNYTVTATAGAGGTVSPATQTVKSGLGVTVQVNANGGYSIASVSGCNGSMSGSTYVIPSVTSNCNVQASFKQDVAVEYTVTATAGAGGSVSPATQKVQSGLGATVKLTANSGYTIASATGCSGNLSGSTYVINSVTSNCTVVANFKKDEPTEQYYTVKAAVNGVGGTVTPATQSILGGTAAMVQVNANSGYTVSQVIGCGGELTGSTYLIMSVTANCTVQASFKADAVVEYTVSTSAGVGGSISPTSKKVVAGQGTSFTVTAASGYAIADVIGCNGTRNGTTYSIPSVNTNCTVIASFKTDAVIEYTVNTVAGTGGSISPSSKKVAAGQSASFNVTPNNGFSVSNVVGCGGSLLGSTYTIQSVTSNCTVQAFFKADAVTEYMVSASAGAGGSISPTSKMVASGQSTSFTVTANSGYKIESVSGCGGQLNGSNYTTSNITGTCTVVANFVEEAPEEDSEEVGGSTTPLMVIFGLALVAIRRRKIAC